MKRRAVIVQHAPREGPGPIAHALEKHGFRVELVRIDRGERLPERPDCDALVLLGGPAHLHGERSPALDAEIDFVKRALAEDVPVLGVCLGSQILAVALGGAVAAAAQPEVGFLPVTVTEEGARDPVLSSVPRSFVALHWHEDVFSLPPECTPLASSARTECQAYRRGKSLGLLFHVEAWLDAFLPDPSLPALTAGPARDALRADEATFRASMAEVAERLFCSWAMTLEAPLP